MSSIALDGGTRAVPGLEIEHAAVVSIGGGLGSFALVDRLRVAGVPADDIRVVGLDADPSATFARTCRASGMLLGDRLRSDSSARMDNIWGFPGYAATEARQLRNPLPLLRTLVEPILAQPYTPTVGLLTDGIAREAARIGWPAMVRVGEAHRILPRPEGGFRVLVRREDGGDLAIDCDHVHLALGAAGPQHSELTDLYRTRYGNDRVRHAYEPHEEVYQALRRGGGKVLVRGSGIASSRVIQRLVEDRDHTGEDVHIWQLFRHYHDAPSGPLTARFDASCGYHYQAFSFPKAAFGGQLRDQIRTTSGEERRALVKELGATSTPYRSLWSRQLRRGRSEGWYDAVAGELVGLAPGQRALPGDPAEGLTAAVLLQNDERLDLDLDFVIDATGRDTDAAHHPLIRALVVDRLVELNEDGGIVVDDSFAAVRCSPEGHGSIFATGLTAQGGALGPVDSFLGLQSAALTISRCLAAAGVGQPLTPLRSLRAWRAWMGGTPL